MDLFILIFARLRKLALFVAPVVTALLPVGAMAQLGHVWIADPLEPELHDPVRRILPLIGYEAERGDLNRATMLKFPDKPYFFIYFAQDYFCLHTDGCLTLIVRLDGDRAIAEFITYSDGVIGIGDVVITLGGVPETTIDIVVMRLRAIRVIRSPAGWVVVSGSFPVPHYLPPHPHYPVPPPLPLSRELEPPTPPLSHEDFRKALERFR
jgi:hypothetical protein